MKRFFAGILIAASVGAMGALQLPGAPAHWNSLAAAGAAGNHVKQQDGTILLTKTTDKGVLFFYNGGHEIPVQTGKNYLALCRYEGSVPLQIMLQPIGAQRSPFPLETGKNGLVQLMFTALPGEKAVRFHVVMNQAGKAVLKEIRFEEFKEPANLLANPFRKWSAAKNEGSKGSFSVAAGKAVIVKEKGPGYIAFLSAADFDIQPGKNYRVAFTVKRSKPSVRYNMMISMPGAKRTPYPTVASKGLTGEPETLEYLFTARADEKKVRPHLIVSGEGTVEVTGVAFQELSAAELKKKVNPAK